VCWRCAVVELLKKLMAHSFLIVGAALSAIAALLHIGCIVFGASWYRYFGAGERMARLAASGSIYATLITSVIASVLLVWALYALSGANVIPRLPFTRLALCAITAVYLLRGGAGLLLAVFAPGEQGVRFWFWSSVICLGIGAVYLVGTQQAWLQLSQGVV
jgi:hypothetical protein